MKIVISFKFFYFPENQEVVNWMDILQKNQVCYKTQMAAQPGSHRIVNYEKFTAKTILRWSL